METFTFHLIWLGSNRLVFHKTLRSLPVKLLKLYRYATVVYFICFSIYILFSREPDYLDAETTPGTVVDARSLSDSILLTNHINKGDRPIVRYGVGSETFYFNGSNNVLLKFSNPQGKVRVIYDPGEPSRAAVLQWAGYWVVLSELIGSFLGYSALLIIAIGITGKNSISSGNDSEIKKQMKYN
jgi:hypothetical protein